VKIFFVDEDDDQRETYSLMLQECFPKDSSAPVVVGIPPKPKLSDMKFLVEDEEVVSIVLDEQLKESGIATYLGIELAEYLRGLNKKIPIYILTSYPHSEELSEGEMKVEDILSKQDLPERKDIVGARILRRIDNFLDVSSDREVRFEALLRKSMSESLDEAEKLEFVELDYLRSAPFEVDEIYSDEKLKKLDALELKIQEIENNFKKK
jgi:CheY-like chemotaxis protein